MHIRYDCMSWGSLNADAPPVKREGQHVKNERDITLAHLGTVGNPIMLMEDNDDAVDKDANYRRVNPWQKVPPPMQISIDEDKALIRFLRQIVGSLSGQSYSTIFDYSRYCEYRESPTKYGSNFEVAMHSFIDVINFSIVRMLAQLRAYPVLRDTTLLDILYNEQASNHFGSLVVDVYKNTLIDSGKKYQSKQMMEHCDASNIAKHLQYFIVLTAAPVRDLVFRDVEEYRLMENNANTNSVVKLRDNFDLYITPDRPLLFMIRLALQAMNKFAIEELLTVLNNIQQPKTYVDTTIDKMKQRVFNDDASMGFIDALSRVLAVINNHSRRREYTQDVTSEDFFLWLVEDCWRIAYFADLTAASTNFIRLTTKTDGRVAIMKRNERTIDVVCSELAYMYYQQQ